jgi:hypothetical protein
MNRAEFIERVNARAKVRYCQAVTLRMLEDWNEEGLFPTAQASGGGRANQPDWILNSGHYRRALQICRLKSQGVARFTALRAALWLRGVEIPPGLPRKDIADEYERLRKDALRRVSSPYIPGYADPQQRRKEATLLRQFGPLASVLNVALLAIPPEALLDAYRSARFGDPHLLFSEAVNRHAS